MLSTKRRNTSHLGVADIILFSVNQFIFLSVIEEGCVTNYIHASRCDFILTTRMGHFKPVLWNVFCVVSCIIHWPQISQGHLINHDITKKEAWVPLSLSTFCRFQDSDEPDTLHVFHSFLFQVGYLFLFHCCIFKVCEWACATTILRLK